MQLPSYRHLINELCSLSFIYGRVHRLMTRGNESEEVGEGRGLGSNVEGTIGSFTNIEAQEFMGKAEKYQ